MPADSRRGARGTTFCRLMALVVMSLLGARGVCSAQTYEVVRSFVPAPEGAYPIAGLVQASNGSFYGCRSGGVRSVCSASSASPR